MSYPVPTVEPTEVKYPEDEVTDYSDDNHPNADPDCLDCGGTGFISISACQYGGNIVDEVEKPCACTIDD